MPVRGGGGGGGGGSDRARARENETNAPSPVVVSPDALWAAEASLPAVDASLVEGGPFLGEYELLEDIQVNRRRQRARAFG